MKKMIFLFSFILVIGCNEKVSNSTKADEKQSTKPNIVFIMADDMGYADLSPYGQKLIKTPNLDQMARSGMRFTQHYAGNTVCAPSRCALMTGMHMGHAEVRGNEQTKPSGQAPLSLKAVTVAKLLKAAGYETALIGKWGLGVQNTTGDPLKQGFDSYYGYLDQVLAHNYYPDHLLRNGKKEQLLNKVAYQDTTAWHKGLGSYATTKIAYSHDLFVQEAFKFLDRPRKKPFFLYLPFTIPHDNGEAPEGEMQEVPDFGPYTNKDWSHDTKAYAAMITRMDKDIGHILDKLKEQGIDDNTLVIFTSDNGPMDKDFSLFFNSNGNLRGGKRELYEGGVRVPFIAQWKDKIAPNSSNDHISAFWDFLPTVCELAGIETPKTDGISFLPSLLGKEQAAHEYLYWEFPEHGYSTAIRKGKWKAVRNNMEQDPDGSLELYNIELDVAEENNMAKKFPNIVEELEELMKEAHEPSDIFPMPGEKTFDK